MNIGQLLRNKGTRIFSIRPQLTLSDAAAALSLHRIGALLVSDDQNPIIGILSERDIVKAIAARGATALSETVAEHMTSDVVVCTGEASLIEILEIMTNRKFRHMPVVDGEKPLGIISIGDIVKQRIAQIEAERAEIMDYIANA